MNDYDRFVALVKEFGVPYAEKIEENGNKAVEFTTDKYKNPCDKLQGYNGFASHWEFDNDGKFVAIYHWE